MGSWSPESAWLVGVAAVAVGMTLLWMVQWVRRDASVVDVGWTVAVGGLGAWLALAIDGLAWRRLLVATLLGAWSARLAIYLLFNRVIGHAEDARYARLRRRWGSRANVYFLFFFLAQAALAGVFVLPALVVMRVAPEPLRVVDLAALVVWLAAVSIETLADRQLARFRAARENLGRTCRAGLWRYSRHPNYFGEWLHWWTYVLLGIGASGWSLTLVAPALMLLFLFRITGIPATEAQALARRGEDYRAYQRETSVFIPWFPRRSRP